MSGPPSIADTIKGGFEVHASCGGCGRSKKLDLAVLAAAHGETARPYYLARRMRCGACGHRGARISLAPVNAEGYAQSHGGPGQRGGQ